ncbi:MAG TPA: hypothetical protein VMH27_22165 [Puia sp.]|nr:hypothetical protein [Puia sp.]
MRIFLLVGAILLFLGCSKKSNSGSGAPSVSNGLMPLSVGNYWQYSRVDYDSASGLPKDTVSDGIYIIGEVSVNGTTYFQQNQVSITNINGPSYFINIDSNTLDKIDSASQYTFFKRITADSSLEDSWPDTVSDHCKGHNLLVAFSGNYPIGSYSCLRNEVQVADCTGFVFEKWEYYLKPGLGLVRVQHYKTDSLGNFYLHFSEDLTSYHTD